MGILLVIVNHFLFEKLISLFLKSDSGGKKFSKRPFCVCMKDCLTIGLFLSAAVG